MDVPIHLLVDRDASAVDHLSDLDRKEQSD